MPIDYSKWDDIDSDSDDEGCGGGGALLRFDVRQLKTSVLIDDGVRSVELSMDRRSMLVEKRDDYGCVEVRAYKAGAKPDDEDSDGEEVDDTDPNRRSGLIDIENKDFTVPNFAGLCCFQNCVDRLINHAIGNGEIDLDLGQKINNVLCPSIQLGVSFLTTETFDLAYRHSLNTDPGQCLAHIIQLKRLNHCSNQFHGNLQKSRAARAALEL